MDNLLFPIWHVGSVSDQATKELSFIWSETTALFIVWRFCLRWSNLPFFATTAWKNFLLQKKVSNSLNVYLHVNLRLKKYIICWCIRCTVCALLGGGLFYDLRGFFFTASKIPVSHKLKRNILVWFNAF